MPELPEVETVRRLLAPALVGATFVTVTLRRRGLRRPFHRRLRQRLEGTRVESLDRRGKYLLAALSSGETLVMHLGMTGWMRVVHPDGTAAVEPEMHDHVVFEMSSGAVVLFNDPRRFGSVDIIVRSEAMSSSAPLNGLGPEPLDPSFDGASLAAAMAGRRTPIKVALLDQRLVAGVGNIYASEALHRAGISPRRQAGTIATPAGRPRPPAHRLAAAVKDALNEAIARAEGRSYRSSRFRVYERAGEPCLTRGCRGTIREIVQSGRTTYYCPVCQR